eukprot:3940740-Rhodomonas_salina.1
MPRTDVLYAATRCVRYAATQSSVLTLRMHQYQRTACCYAFFSTDVTYAATPATRHLRALDERLADINLEQESVPGVHPVSVGRVQPVSVGPYRPCAACFCTACAASLHRAVGR